MIPGVFSVYERFQAALKNIEKELELAYEKKDINKIFSLKVKFILTLLKGHIEIMSVVPF
jgi:hypothetical protein